MKELYAQYTNMVVNLTKPADKVISELSNDTAMLLHAYLGIGDEVLELVRAVKEYQSEQTKSNKDHVIEELGDLMFYNEMSNLVLNFELTDYTGLLDVMSVNDSKEFFTIVKLANDAIRYAKRIGIYQKPFNTKDLEIFYISVNSIITDMCKEFDISFKEVMEANMKKLLGGRYKSGTYSNEQANNREDKADSNDD